MRKSAGIVGGHMIGKLVVVVRTYSEGVHIGILAERRGKVVLLKDARRLWRWRGANTLHEVALHGVDESYSRLSEPVPEIVLTQAGEVISVADGARASLTKSRWP